MEMRSPDWGGGGRWSAGGGAGVGSVGGMGVGWELAAASGGAAVCGAAKDSLAGAASGGGSDTGRGRDKERSAERAAMVAWTRTWTVASMLGVGGGMEVAAGDTLVTVAAAGDGVAGIGVDVNTARPTNTTRMAKVAVRRIPMMLCLENTFLMVQLSLRGNLAHSLGVGKWIFP